MQGHPPFSGGFVILRREKDRRLGSGEGDKRRTRMRMVVVLSIFLLASCGLVLPQQTQYGGQQQSQQPVQNFSREYIPSIKSPSDALVSGSLRLSEAYGKGQVGMEFTYAHSGAVEVKSTDVSLLLGFADLGQSSFDHAGYGLIFFRPIGLSLDVFVSGSSAIEVDWNRVSLISPSGQIYKVIHKGQRFQDRGMPSSPSVIPPGSRLSDFVFPSDLVSFELRNWRLGHFFERIDKRGTFGLFFPVKSGASEIQYHIVFTVVE